MKFLPLLILFFTVNIYAQGNFNVEWESPSTMYFQSIMSFERTNAIPEIVIWDAVSTSMKVYDGATKQLKYTYSDPDTSYFWNFTYMYWTTSSIDVNHDGINEIVMNKNRSPYPTNMTLKVINGADGSVLFQNTYANYTGSVDALDIDGDGYVELAVSLYNYTSHESKLIILSTTSSPIAVEPQSRTAAQYRLGQNYPNPFNPSTLIDYSISKDADVKLVLYDVIGREVGTYANEHKKAGSYQVKLDGSAFASGTYFYQLIVNNVPETKKMVILK